MTPLISGVPDCTTSRGDSVRTLVVNVVGAIILILFGVIETSEPTILVTTITTLSSGFAIYYLVISL